MAKGQSYNIIPKMEVVPNGTLLKNRNELFGTNGVGVNVEDETFTFGNEPITIPAESICMYVEDEQFMSADKEHPMSAWVRVKMIAGDKIIWYTLLVEPKRIWDFETFRGKQRIIRSALENQFEILEDPEVIKAELAKIKIPTEEQEVQQN